MSKVMSNGNGRIKFPINEPAEGKKNHKSRSILILWWTGIQHIATDDIIKTISQLKARGVEFCLLHLIRIIRRFQNDWETI
jgi:4-hydroxyphenylpyruvate dioxygenase